MRGRIPDIFFGFEFQKDRLKNVGAVGVKFLAFPLTWHIAYTTACCYRTSRERREGGKEEKRRKGEGKREGKGKGWERSTPTKKFGLRPCT